MKTKLISLISENQNEYPNINIKCKIVDNIKSYVNSVLEQMENCGKKPAFAKSNVLVKVRKGVLGEKVKTRCKVLVDGKIYFLSETVNTVKEKGSMVVTNPDGEEFVVLPKIFKTGYEKTEKQGVFKRVDDVIKYIIVEEDIVFIQAYGEEMCAIKGAALNISDMNDIYAIQNVPFEKTYIKIS